MTEIKAKTLFGDLTFIYEKNKVSVKGNSDALIYWRFLKNQGLFGAYGFTLDLQDCLLSDLTNALAEKIGEENLSWDKNAQSQIDDEMEIPSGAIP